MGHARCVELLEEALELFNSRQYDEALDLLEQIKSELSSSNFNENMLKT
jgi:predicted house-cleaning noncanonical NTP pyrophosphatase (MazG superfamily)